MYQIFSSFLILFLQFVVEIKKKRKFEQNCYFIFEEAKKQLLESDMSLEPLVNFMIENVSTACWVPLSV